MAATERLSRAQVIRDVRNFLWDSAKRSSRKSFQTLLGTHPEILYAEQHNGSRREKAGKIPSELARTAEPHLAKARQNLKNSESYSSPTFTHKGKSYFVFSQRAPDPRAEQSLVVLVSSEVIQAVERHQRRNMRLVPYPPEGRYRIESVVPGSNAETTVRTGEDNGNASHYAVDEIVVKFRSPLTERQLLQLRKDLHLTVVRYTGKPTYSAPRNMIRKR